MTPPKANRTRSIDMDFSILLFDKKKPAVCGLYLSEQRSG